MRKPFYLTMLSEFCSQMEQTRIQHEEEIKQKEKDFKITYTEKHKWCLYYEDLGKQKKRYSSLAHRTIR
jgi:hypothetical protein